MPQSIPLGIDRQKDEVHVAGVVGTLEILERALSLAQPASAGGSAPRAVRARSANESAPRTGHNSWRAVSEAFLLFSSAAHGPFPGFAQGVQRLEQNIEFTGPDRIASDATVEFLDASGTVTLSGCARAVGTRFE